MQLDILGVICESQYMYNTWCKMYDLASFLGSHAPEREPWSCAYLHSTRAWERGYVWPVYVACMCRAHVAR